MCHSTIIEPTPMRSGPKPDYIDPEILQAGSGDQLVAQVADEAEARIKQRHEIARGQSALTMVDEQNAYSIGSFWHYLSPEARVMAGEKFTSLAIDAGHRHRARCRASEETRNRSLQTLRSIRSSYETAIDKAAVVKFVVSQLRAL